MSACTVLIIDDEKAVAELLTKALTRFGYAVVTAIGGKQGIDMFDSAPVDVVVTDILMPHVDGSDVVRHIRKSGSRGGTPVIAMSGTPSLLGNQHFDAVIPKPFSIYELLDKVKHACAASRPETVE